METRKRRREETQLQPPLSRLCTLQELVSANAMIVQGIICGEQLEEETHQRVLAAAEKFARRGQILTATFGGILTDMLAHEQVREACRTFLGIDEEDATPTIRYSATEVGSVQQSIILESNDPPLHLFGNVLERLMDEDRSYCMAKQRKMLAAYLALKTEFQLLNKSKRQLAAEVEALGAQYVGELKDKVSMASFKEMVWCEVCKDLCYVSPRQGLPEELRFRDWVEVAGSSCVSWTHVLQTTGGFCSKSTLPMLVWSYSERFYQPDMVVHECVKRFPLHNLIEIFCAKEFHVISEHIRPTEDREHGEPRQYVADSKVFAPTCIRNSDVRGAAIQLILFSAIRCECWGCMLRQALSFQAECHCGNLLVLHQRDGQEGLRDL